MKLPNGFGSVYKLSGKRRNPYVARKTVGWTWDEEKQKSFPVYEFIGYYPTRKEALTALTDYNKNPYDIEASKITFGELYEKWTDEHFPKISKSNKGAVVASYKLCSELEDMKVVDIKLVHLQKVVDDSGKNLPALKKLKVMFSLMWDYAIKHEILTPDKKDLIKYVDISQAGNPNSIDRHPFSNKEIKTLWEHQSNDIVSIVLILIYTGLRIGELLNLKKEDVHLQDRWFYVRQAKTEAGVREVPIAEKVVPFFEAWMKKDGDNLIVRSDGKGYRYTNFYEKQWTPIMSDLGMKHTVHDTRHTCVSLLTSAGVDDRIIKKIVGHKGTDVTERVYTHLDLPIKLEAINKI